MCFHELYIQNKNNFIATNTCDLKVLQSYRKFVITKYEGHFPSTLVSARVSDVKMELFLYGTIVVRQLHIKNTEITFFTIWKFCFYWLLDFTEWKVLFSRVLWNLKFLFTFYQDYNSVSNLYRTFVIHNAYAPFLPLNSFLYLSILLWLLLLLWSSRSCSCCWKESTFHSL